MLERTFSGRLLDASACPSQWDSGGSCGRRRQCPPWRLTLHEGAGNERVSGHRTGLLCVQKAEEREWTGAVAQAGPRACKGPGACCSRNHQAEGGGSGAEWEGEEPFGGCGGFSFSPESGEPWEGVELGIGEVASGVHRSLLAAAGAASESVLAPRVQNVSRCSRLPVPTGCPHPQELHHSHHSSSWSPS